LAALLLATVSPTVAGAWSPGTTSRGEAPEPTGPAHGAIVDGTPIVSWKPVADAREYLVELARDAAFTQPYLKNGGFTRSTTFTLATLPVGRWWWRVRATSIWSSQIGPASSPRAFVTRPVLTTAPSLTAPADGTASAYPDEVQPLRWSRVAGATGYEVQFASDSRFTTQLTSARVDVPMMDPLLDRRDVLVYWRVRAYRSWDRLAEHELEHGSWSGARTYRLDSTPPADPRPAVTQVTLVAPANGATVEDTLDATLRWTPDPGAVGYQLQLVRADLDFEPIDPAVNVVLPKSEPQGWVQPGPHKWHVRSIAEDGSAGPWSAVWQLTYADATGPGIVSPAPEGSQLPASKTLVRWSSAPYAPLTALSFSRTAAFDEARHYGPLLADVLEPRLPGAGVWHWRVSSLGWPLVATTEAGSFEVVDDVPPSGVATLESGGPVFVEPGTDSISLGSLQEDAHGAMKAIHVSLDGATWETHAMDASTGDTTIPVTDPAWGGTTPGARSVWVRWEDEAGNLTSPQRLTYWYDTDPPQAPPTEPLFASAVAGNGKATVSWQAPVGTGGWPISGYEVVGTPGGRCITAGARSCTVAGLSNGVPYTFRVLARNGAFESAPSEPTASVTPRGTLPKAAMRTLGAVQTSTSITVRWSGTAGSAPLFDYDVRYRRAPWNGTYGSRTTWRTATTATSGVMTVAKGYTYCFSARARDTQGARSAWSSETCTAIPLDDRSLKRSSGWTRATNRADYAGTNTRSSTGGATLTRTGISGRRISVVATTCPTCGVLRAYWRGTLIRTIDLQSSTTRHRRVFTLATFSTRREGTLVLRVVGRTGRVIIDGLAVRR
jgi:hypothetical protein